MVGGVDLRFERIELFKFIFNELFSVELLECSLSTLTFFLKLISSSSYSGYPRVMPIAWSHAMILSPVF